jgi:UDP-N-acetylmuramoylalanine--D-glutamate ligase
MSTRQEFKVVVGLGKTGISCVRFLVEKGYQVAVTDSRENPPDLIDLQANFPQVKAHVGGFDEELLQRATELIVSPGVSLHEPAIARQVQRGVAVCGDIELFAQQNTKPVVAVTGSNGKSTVTSLMGHLLAHAGLNVKVGGNFGVPALDLLEDDRTEIYVLELSSFQLETTYSLNCRAAVNLNISPDHMDRYPSIKDYAAAKLRIYQHCQQPIINLDDPLSHDLSFAVMPIGFSLGDPKLGEFGLRRKNNSIYLAFGEQCLLPTCDLPLKGQHQYANVLAALALGYAVGLSMDGMLQALMTFQGLPHRCQWVRKFRGVDWYNDSKATNVGATQAALLGIAPEIAGKVVLLAGGQGKNADFSTLYAPVAQCVRAVILFGQDQESIALALQGATQILPAKDLLDAVAIASQVSLPGDVVMLSPACASFDMFRNFEHRGEVFIEAVQGLCE